MEKINKVQEVNYKIYDLHDFFADNIFDSDIKMKVEDIEEDYKTVVRYAKKAEFRVNKITEEGIEKYLFVHED